MKQQVAVYLRLSQEDVDKRTSKVKDESNSITSQRILINRHLDLNPALQSLPRIEFCDDGFSGTNFERPGFAQMINLAKRGEISCIVVKDLSRFGRDYLEVGDYLEHIFPFLGIRFKSINDHYDSDQLQGKTIGMDVAFRNLIYDYYSKDLSKKVKSAMRMKQKDCSYVSSAPFGYRIIPGQKHRMVIDPETAPIVRRAFLDVIAGKSCTTIAKELNTEGVPTPAMAKSARKGKDGPKQQWTHRSVLRLIENIKYTGTMVNHTKESRFIRDRNQRRVPREEWFIKENAHEGIVTAEEYNAAQAAIKRRRKSSKAVHDQSDRVFYCAHCGNKLEKSNGTVFACPSHRYYEGSPCAKVRWRKDALEEILFESLKRQIQITKVTAADEQHTANKNGAALQFRLSALKTQYESMDQEKFSLYEKYREGNITTEQYLIAKDALTEKQAALKGQLAECEEQMVRQFDAESGARMRQQEAGQMAGLSDEQSRKHLYDGVEKVLVYDAATIEIVWKFSGPERISGQNGFGAAEEHPKLKSGDICPKIT